MGRLVEYLLHINVTHKGAPFHNAYLLPPCAEALIINHLANGPKLRGLDYPFMER